MPLTTLRRYLNQSEEEAGCRRVISLLLDGIADHQQGETQMIAAATWPSGQNNEATGRYEDYAGGQGPPAQPSEGHEPAHLVIAEMADLVRDTSGSAIVVMNTSVTGGGTPDPADFMIQPGSANSNTLTLTHNGPNNVWTFRVVVDGTTYRLTVTVS